MVPRETDQAGSTDFVTVTTMPYSQRTQSVAHSGLQQVALGCSQTALRPCSLPVKETKGGTLSALETHT